MALFDFLDGIFGAAPNPSAAASQQPPPQGGLLDPGGPAPGQQKWINALNGISAALKDAGAYYMRQPEAASNLAVFNQQRQQRLQDQIGPLNYNNMLLGMAAKPATVPAQLFPNGLPPAAAAWLLLQRLQQHANTVSQDTVKPAQPAAPTPDANTGWSIERVQ